MVQFRTLTVTALIVSLPVAVAAEAQNLRTRELTGDEWWRPRCATESYCKLIPTDAPSQGQALVEGETTVYNFDQYTDYSISCTTSGGETNRVEFWLGEVQSHTEWGSPYTLNGDSNGIAFPSNDLSGCGTKSVTVSFQIWNGECFRKTFELEACGDEPDDNPCPEGYQSAAPNDICVPDTLIVPENPCPNASFLKDGSCECMEGYQKEEISFGTFGFRCIPICTEYVNEWIGFNKGCVPNESRCASTNDSFACAALAVDNCGGCGTNEVCVNSGENNYQCVCDNGMGRLEPEGECVSVCLDDIYGACGKYRGCYQSAQGAYCSAYSGPYVTPYDCEGQCEENEICLSPKIGSSSNSDHVCVKKQPLV